MDTEIYLLYSQLYKKFSNKPKEYLEKYLNRNKWPSYIFNINNDPNFDKLRKTILNDEKIMKEFLLKQLKIEFKDSMIQSQYNIIDELGSGNFGTAILVSSRDNPKNKYVIKKINLDKFLLSSEAYPLEMINNEISIMKKLTKYNLCPKIYDSYIYKEEDGIKVFIEMEYMNYGTLRQYLKNHKLTEQNIKIINYKINTMHDKGIIHRDLSQDNIFLNKSKNNKIDFYIGDFGSSYFIADKINEDKRKDHLGFLNDNHTKEELIDILVFYILLKTMNKK
jgi:serine/threonine protein kinase